MDGIDALDGGVWDTGSHEGRRSDMRVPGFTPLMWTMVFVSWTPFIIVVGCGEPVRLSSNCILEYGLWTAGHPPQLPEITRRLVRRPGLAGRTAGRGVATRIPVFVEGKPYSLSLNLLLHYQNEL